MLPFKPKIYGLVIISVLFALYGCGEKDTSQAPVAPSEEAVKENRFGGEYLIPLLNQPGTLDPARIQDDYAIYVAYQLFDGLVQFGPYLSILPAVAENWQIEENGKLIRFFLRADVQFHHGKNVTTRDVMFSLKRLLRVEPAPFITPYLLKIQGAQAFRNKSSEHVEGLRAIDDLRLEMHLIEPYAPLLGALAIYQAAIVPEEVVVQEGEKFGRAPVGCGPFRFIDWKPDQSIEIGRFKNYYNGSAYLEKINFRIYPGAQLDLILEAFKALQLHEMPVYGAVKEKLSRIEDLQWVHRPSLSLLYYGVNTKNPVLKDIRLRRAIAQAINRQQLVETVYQGQFEPAYSVLPPGMPAHNREFALIEENIPDARELVTQVQASNRNWKPEIEIVSSSKSAFAQAELDFVEKALAEIGINTRKKYITEWSKFKSYLSSDSLQLFRFTWTADLPDPDNFLYPLFGVDSTANRTKFFDEHIDSQLKQASGMVDPVQRAQLYQKIEQQVMQSYPLIPLFYLSIDRVYQPNVMGVYSSALGAHNVRLHRFWLSLSSR